MKIYNTSSAAFSPADKKKLDALVAPLKTNLSASRAPLATDDKDAGYAAGSTWIFNGTTYTCTDATAKTAIWTNNADLFYFDTWAQLLAAINTAGTTYVDKYATVANANGGPGSGTTYIGPAPVTNQIVDGGDATFKILTQGISTYSVKCQARTVTNPVITKIYTTNVTLPTIAGYYIFTVVPTQGIPIGNLNDILYYSGSSWSVYQAYAKATTVLVSTSVSGSTQVTWRKFAGTWMSTAEEYIPDGLEYQTGKLWNGKAVYRKCKSGNMTGTLTQNASAGFSVPMTGSIISIAGICNRTDNAIITITGNGEAQILVQNTGAVVTWTSTNLYLNRPFTAWVEYTKS